MMRKINDFYGFIGNSEYAIGSVLYKVSSSFAPANICNLENTMSEKVEKYVGSDFAHLTNADDRNTMNAEYICLTAGKED